MLAMNCFWSQWTIIQSGLRPYLFERLLANRLNSYIESEGVLPQTQFGYRKGLGTVDALLTLTGDIQGALNDGMEVRAVAIDFSSAFDKVNHKGISDARKFALYFLLVMASGSSMKR